MDLGTRVGPWLTRRPWAMRSALRTYALTKGCRVRFDGAVIDVERGSGTVRVSSACAPYVRDIVDDFVHYFDAVHTTGEMVDYSVSRDHDLVGWRDFPVRLPSLPEPMETAHQYLELTTPRTGDTILDLGAYAGVTAMAFQDAVGPSGRVIAVEADAASASCARINFGRYEQARGVSPALVEAAMWSSDGYLEFTAEAALGSSVSALLERGSAVVSVPSVTLSSLVASQGVNRVDVIKADIEGAEFATFSDSSFFTSAHPVIVFEPASTRIRETQLEPIASLLTTYGYRLQEFPQRGSRLPLVVAR